MRDSYAARVRRGVAFLDETVNDDWHLKIDLDSLDLADGEHCVLGQLWQDKLPEDYSPDEAYDVAKDELDLSLRDDKLGFVIAADDDFDDGFRWLTIRWRQAIEEKIG